MSDTPLPPETFVVLAAVAWADDRLEPREAEAIMRAAEEQGYAPTQLVAIEQALKTRRALTEVDFSGLTPEQRLYLYAIATWVATLRWGINDRERALLGTLRERLHLSVHQAGDMDEALSDLLLQPHGLRPDRFDFSALSRVIDERLAASRAETPARGVPRIGGGDDDER
jgi:hypothetical protein